jgi:tetratricopeptide (TPR) repeat protein
LAVALVVAVFLVYQPAWQGSWLWDDDSHLLNNPVLKHGGLARTWTPGGYINYWPVTFTIYWLEFQLWGLDPLGFHLVNIGLHALAALLVWRVLATLHVPGAKFAAAIFALHPVNVESVAWVSQLKGVLSLVLALVSMLIFLAEERRGGWWRSLLAVGAFWLSTLAKGMVITLPVVLLACAWWQRGRIDRRDLLRVLPFLVVGAIMAGVEVWTQHLVGHDADVRSDGFLSRTAIAGCAVWFYLWKLVWPLNLCLVYPRWQIDDRNVLSYVPAMLLVLIGTLASWRRPAWGRPTVMLVVCYAGLLLPALGFVSVYFMRYSFVADHYQYAAMIVPCALFAGAAVTLVRSRIGFPRLGWYALCLGLLAVLAVLSRWQSRTYADIETLFQTTIDRNPNCWMAYNNLGMALAGRGQIEEAMAHYEKALEINPNDADAYNNLGMALAGRGQFERAMAHYQKALEINPEKAEARSNLGIALASCGRATEAIAQYRIALKIKPGYAAAHLNLGVALAGLGQLDEAITQYLQALEINPDYVAAHTSLGNVLVGRGRIDEAIAHYRQALEINPDHVEAQANLGVALARRGRLDEAITHFQKALKVKPDSAETHFDLGRALAGRGQVGDAMAHYQKALDLASARNDKALVDVIRARIRQLKPVLSTDKGP